MPGTIHIIEPTLEDDAGHCHNFVASVCRADPSQKFRAWIGRRAGERVLAGLPNVDVRRYFDRRFRRPLQLALMRRLLRQPGKILVTTASTLDLMILDLAAGAGLPSGKAYLYFHWFRSRKGKLDQFRRVARRRPHLVTMGPTAEVEEVLKHAGFEAVHRVAYPIPLRASGRAKPVSRFRTILYAGQARRDKGFHHVVDLVSHLGETGSMWPVTLQTAAEHYGKVEPEIREDIRRLDAIGYEALTKVPATMAYEEYLELFPGSICLQLYRVEDFSDRISTVTLDATSLGAPVITRPGTWMAQVVDRFGAGKVLEDISPRALEAAIRLIRSRYGEFHEKALEAGHALREEHDPGRLLKALGAEGPA